MQDASVYRFNQFELRAAQRKLLRQGVEVELGDRAFDVLVALVERNGEVVTKSQLLDLVWPDVAVEESNVQVQVSALRKQLGRNAIATIQGRGYRFTAPLEEAVSLPTVVADKNRNTLPFKDRTSTSFWVAVQPFEFTGQDSQLSDLAAGLTEEIVTGLSRFSYLRVLTKDSSRARYVLEGSLRQAGSELRVTAKLIDTSTGANLWAENYTRPYSPDNIFEMQDSLAPTIVSTVAEMNGVLTHSMWVTLRDRDPETLTPYEAMVRGLGYLESLTPEEHRLSLSALLRAIKKEPNHCGCLAILSMIYADGYLWGFCEDEKSADLGVAYAKRAVDIEPSDGLAHYALTWAYSVRREIPEFRAAADRALELNPWDGGMQAGIGMFLAYSGEWEKGCALIQQAMQLNPRHPGWYWLPLAMNAYRGKDYSQARDYTLRANLPGFFRTYMMFAMVQGQLGNRDEAAEALDQMLAMNPDFADHARQELEKWYAEPAFIEHVLDGLRKAGFRERVAALPAIRPIDQI